jgi:hypothetical protein
MFDNLLNYITGGWKKVIDSDPNIPPSMKETATKVTIDAANACHTNIIDLAIGNIDCMEQYISAHRAERGPNGVTPQRTPVVPDNGAQQKTR